MGGTKGQRQDEAQVPDRYLPGPGLTKAQQPTGSPRCKGWMLAMVSLGSGWGQTQPDLT